MVEYGPQQETKSQDRNFRFLVGFLIASAPVLGYGLLQLAQANPEAAWSVVLLAGVATLKMLPLRRG